MSYEVSKEDIERVEKALQDDIRWAIVNGVGWDPMAGADGTAAGFVAYDKDGGGKCGVCAIGAHCVRRQPPGDDDEEAAAASLGVPLSLIADVYYSVAVKRHERANERPSAGQSLGYRLRDFADALQAEVKP